MKTTQTILAAAALLAIGATTSASASTMKNQAPAQKMTSSLMTTNAQVKNAVYNNIKTFTSVSAAKLNAAVYPGPFTAGVNQIIPFEAFGGDGMLTRLLLNASNGAAWSDNGTAQNKAILPLSNLTTGKYFYEVDLTGTKGLTGQDLLTLLKNNGTKTYQATVKVYGTDKKTIVASKKISVEIQTQNAGPVKLSPETTKKVGVITNPDPAKVKAWEEYVANGYHVTKPGAAAPENPYVTDQADSDFYYTDFYSYLVNLVQDRG